MKSASYSVAKRAALQLLERGEAHPAEIAALAGVSRMTIHRWAREAGIDWEQAHRDRLARVWRKAELRRQGKRPKNRPTKQQLRRMADRAYAEWVKRNGKDEPREGERAPAD